MQKLVIITFTQPDAPSSPVLSQYRTRACTNVQNIALTENIWRPGFDYGIIRRNRLSTESRAMFGHLVGTLMLLKGSVIFDLRSINGLVPQTGCEIFNTVVHHASLDPCAALIDENSSQDDLKDVFSNNSCYHRPMISPRLSKIIRWFDNIDRLIAA